MSERDFAAWADPTSAAPVRGGKRRPLAGLVRDLRLLASSVGKVPAGVPAGRGTRTTPPNPSLRRAFGRVQSPTLDVLVTGRARVGVPGPALVLAHLEDPSDLRLLLGALLPSWRSATLASRLVSSDAIGIEGLAAGRGGLLAGDLESAAGQGIFDAAVRAAVRFGVPVIPVTVQRSIRPSADRVAARAAGPRPLVRGDVHVRFGRALWPTQAELGAALRTAIGRLVAEDAHNWWVVERGQAAAGLDSDAAQWRRNWQRSEPRLPASEGRRPQIWR